MTWASPSLCDSIFMIFSGKKVLHGTLASIESRYGSDTIRVSVAGGLPSDTALHYTVPVAITKQVVLNAVAFDRAGNIKTLTGTYKPPADTTPTPSAITAITGTAGQASALPRQNSK